MVGKSEVVREGKGRRNEMNGKVEPESEGKTLLYKKLVARVWLCKATTWEDGDEIDVGGLGKGKAK